MQSIIRSDFESTMVIAVVHRLRSIMDFDRVLELLTLVKTQDFNLLTASMLLCRLSIGEFL